MAYNESFLNRPMRLFTRSHDIVSAACELVTRGYKIINVYVDSKYIYFEVNLVRLNCKG